MLIVCWHNCNYYCRALESAVPPPVCLDSMGSADKTLMIYDTLTRFYWLVSVVGLQNIESIDPPPRYRLAPPAFYGPFLLLFNLVEDLVLTQHHLISIWSSASLNFTTNWSALLSPYVISLPFDTHPHSKLYLNEHWVHTLILDNVKIVAGQFSKPNFHSSSSIKVKSYHKMHLNEGRLWPREVSQSWSKTKLCQASAMPIFPSFCFYKWAVSPQKKITNMNILLWVTLLKGKFQARLKFLEMAK